MSLSNDPTEALGDVRYYDVEGQPYRVAGNFPVAQIFRDGAWVAGRLLSDVFHNGQPISAEEMRAWLIREEGASGDPTAIPFARLWQRETSGL